jgi:sugar/nucleoside kinase (ribokinase family)
MFVDLADPEKRTREDILRALNLVGNFRKYFEVILGLNEKEAYEIGCVLDLDTSRHSREGLVELARQIRGRTSVRTLVVHPVTYAFSWADDGCHSAEGPFIEKPLITTGAGDHFNAGFCLGKLLGFDEEMAVLVGVATSGFYVRNAASPRLADLAEMLRHWPTRDE